MQMHSHVASLLVAPVCLGPDHHSTQGGDCPPCRGELALTKVTRPYRNADGTSPPCRS